MKKVVKKLSVIAVLTLFALTTTIAQTGTSSKEKLKKHHCTSACKKEKHVYAHGEKGHVCTDECTKLEKASTKKS